MRAVVAGVGHHLPAQTVSNRDVEARVEATTGFRLPPGMIELLTGVKERRFAPDDATSSDLAAAAGTAALESAGVEPGAVDLVIFAAASQDVIEPSTAAITQSKLGCRNAATTDVKDACNGFLHAVDLAASLIETGRAERVLVTSGEVLSPVVDWQIADLGDLRTKLAGLTLGDAGAAFLLQASTDTDRGVLPGGFLAAGDHWRLSTVLAGGSLMRQSAEGRYFSSSSLELSRLALEHLPPLMRKVIEGVGWSPEDVSLAVPHQVTRMLVTELARRAGFPAGRCAVTLDRFGNCAAASIPLAVSLAAAEGRLRPGDRLLLVAGAAGFSAGVLPVVW